jgi:hypothetical protein
MTRIVRVAATQMAISRDPEANLVCWRALGAWELCGKRDGGGKCGLACVWRSSKHLLSSRTQLQTGKGRANGPRRGGGRRQHHPAAGARI